MILKVTNELSADEKYCGLTLESLLKLHQAKAFDQRTSVLQYVIILIHRHDKEALTFPEEVATSVCEASRVNMDSIEADIQSLSMGFQQHRALVMELMMIQKEKTNKEKDENDVKINDMVENDSTSHINNTIINGDDKAHDGMMNSTDMHCCYRHGDGIVIYIL